jgi:site-specific recombinase
MNAVAAVAAAAEPEPARLEDAIRVLQDGMLAVRPDPALTPLEQGAHASRQLLALCEDAVHLDRLRLAVRTLLAIPSQQSFFAETGLHRAKGFTLELAGRIGQRLLPVPAQGGSLYELVQRVVAADDHRWIPLVSPTAWARVLEAVSPAVDTDARAVTQRSLGEAARMLSYRLAGCALDRELLRADAALEEHESPFLALNALLVPWLDRLRATGVGLSTEEGRSAEQGRADSGRVRGHQKVPR